MGFLDRMVADMIKQGTGYNARGLVRRIGGRRMLMLGGAALGGALLSDQMKGGSVTSMTPGGTAAPSSGTRHVPIPRSSSEAAAVPSRAVPPPPPVVSSEAEPSTVPPPPPPVPPAAPEHTSDAGEEAVAEELPPELLFAIVRSMVAAALADGELSDAERETIHSRLAEAPFSQEQVAQVNRDLVVPPSPHELAGMVETDDREVLLRFATLVALAHEGVSDRERTWLGGFARALEIDGERQRTIEAEILV